MRSIAEQELSGRLSKIELALTYLQPNIDLAAHESATANKLEEMHGDIKSMDKKLNTIIFDLSKIKIWLGKYIFQSAFREGCTRKDRGDGKWLGGGSQKRLCAC